MRIMRDRLPGERDRSERALSLRPRGSPRRAAHASRSTVSLRFLRQAVRHPENDDTHDRKASGPLDVPIVRRPEARSDVRRLPRARYVQRRAQTWPVNMTIGSKWILPGTFCPRYSIFADIPWLFISVSSDNTVETAGLVIAKSTPSMPIRCPA